LNKNSCRKAVVSKTASKLYSCLQCRTRTVCSTNDVLR
jgi:hypothetical protein